MRRLIAALLVGLLGSPAMAATPVTPVAANGTPMKMTYFGYPMESLESLEFYDTIDGTSINTNLWAPAVSTMTVTQTSATILVNATASTTANAYAILPTVPTFWDTSCIPLHAHFTLGSTLWALDANSVMEFGWGAVSTNTAPTDGAFVRVTNGQWYLVANNAGTETLKPITAPLPAANAINDYTLNIYGDVVEFHMQGTASSIDEGPTYSLNMKSTQGALVSSPRQPFFVRVYNTASVPAASPTVSLGQISIQQRNANFDKPWQFKLAGMGRNSVQSPVSTFTQTANWTNSTEPASATLSNTTPGYTTLGGKFAFAAPGGAATDFTLFGFQVPAAYQFHPMAVYISTMNGLLNGGAVGAVVAGTPTVLEWFIASDASAASLATADGTGTWQPRRFAVCTQSFPVGAAIGATATDCSMPLPAPQVTQGARWFTVGVRVPIGTATANQIIRGNVSINGFFE